VPVLHCTDDSQQTVEKGHSRRFARDPAISAIHPIVLQNDFGPWSEENFFQIKVE
jgi:hypothetical protein